jgi:hypothetical protein
MERKERNAEGKTSACQIASFISAMFYKIFTKKIYILNVIIFKNEKVFLKMIFVDKKKRLLDKLGNVLQFYVEIVIFIRNQVC